MKRITQSLFEEIQKVTSEQIDEKKNLTHDEDKDGDEDAADYMMKRRKAGGQSHAQSHAATRKHNEEVEVQDTADTPIDELQENISNKHKVINVDQMDLVDHIKNKTGTKVYFDGDDMVHQKTGKTIMNVKVHHTVGDAISAVKNLKEAHWPGTKEYKEKFPKDEFTAHMQRFGGDPKEDKFLTQEEFDTLSEEDQEIYLEQLEQLDELSKGMQRLARKVIPGQGQKQAGERAKDQGYSAALDREALKYHSDKKLSTSMKSSEKAQQRYKRIARGESPFGVKEEVELEEGISETIIKHNDFVLEITNNPTFADFLNAAKSFVDSEEEAVAVAEAFYAEQDDSIIIEAFTRADIDAKVAAHQKAGHTVSMPKFSTKGGEPYAEYVVSDKETKVRRKYIHHGTARRVENMGTPGKKDKGEK